MNETYVVDGMNVCWWYSQTHPKEVSIQPLLTVLVTLLENGDDFYCVFDASISHTVGFNGKEADAAKIEQLLRQHPERFYRVTGSTRADGVILHDANHHDRKIITNDIFRDYKEKYPWLADKYTQRLIQGNIQPSGLMTLEKLPYGQLQLRTDTELVLRRIHELLMIQKTPEVSELDKHLKQRFQSLHEIDERLQGRETQRVQLIRQIGNLESQRDELKAEIAEHHSLSNEINELRAQLKETRVNLGALYRVSDFNSVEKIMNEKLSKLKSDITSLEDNFREKKLKCAILELDAKEFQAVLLQKKNAEEFHQLELRDDQVCIRKAQTAISAFLEPYPDRYGRPIMLPFDGSSWNAAVKKLKIYFDRNRVCTHCYECNSSWTDKCLACKKGEMSDNPKELWEIIEQFAPSNILNRPGLLEG